MRNITRNKYFKTKTYLSVIFNDISLIFMMMKHSEIYIDLKPVIIFKFTSRRLVSQIIIASDRQLVLQFMSTELRYTGSYHNSFIVEVKNLLKIALDKK